MYEEKPKKKIVKKNNKKQKKKNYKQITKNISWPKINEKLIVLFSAIIIVVFTIFRIKENQKMKNNNFETNFTKIIDGSLQFYQNHHLPKNLGDSHSLVLKDLYDLKFIFDIKDYNNKYCDYQNSYILLTKLDSNQFLLKIHLKCPHSEKDKEEKVFFSNQH